MKTMSHFLRLLLTATFGGHPILVSFERCRNKLRKVKEFAHGHSAAALGLEQVLSYCRSHAHMPTEEEKLRLKDLAQG